MSADRSDATAALSRFQQFVEQVRDRTDLLSIVESDGHTCERSANAHRCLSPFRKETDASFFIYPDGKFFDFGDRSHGDAFTYIQRRDGINFKDAVAVLAVAAGIEPYWTRDGSESDEALRAELGKLLERRRVAEHMTEAATYLHRNLPSRLRSHLKSNYGMDDGIIDWLRIGYDDGTLVDFFLDDLDMAIEEALSTGLFVPRKESRPVDFYTGRIVFPYWVRGQVAYTIGRRTEFCSDESYDKAKYKKQQIRNDRHPYVSQWIGEPLFGEDYIRQKVDRLIITEGITDAIALIQRGFRGMSPVTVRFKKSQFPTLLAATERAKRIFLSNDADVTEDGKRPGEEGALQTAMFLFANKRDVRLVDLPRPDGVSKVDTCEFLRDHGADAYEQLIESAKRLPDFLIDRVSKDLPADERSRALEPVLQVIGSCDPIERDEYVGHVAKRFKVSKKAVAAKLGELRGDLPSKSTASVPDDLEAAGSDDDNDYGGREAEPKSKKKLRSTRPGERIKGEVIGAAGCYICRAQNGMEDIISSFVLEPKQRIVEGSTGRDLLQCDIVCDSGRVISDFMFPRSSWSTRRDFIRTLPSVDLQWTGTDDHVQGVLRIVSSVDVPTRLGTPNLGYCDTPSGPRWVWPGGAIDPDGIMLEPDVIYTGTSSMSERLLYESVPEEDVLALASRILPALIKINEPHVILPILGWFYATAFKPRIMRRLSHFPLLFVWGTAGSGKTSVLRDVMWPLLGVAKRTEPYSCTDTEFAMYKNFSSTDSCPLVIDEFKPRDLGRIRIDRIQRLMRRIYGGEVEERGRADLTTTSYFLGAPVCFAGEAAPDDTAVMERLVCVNPNKNNVSIEPFQSTFAMVRGYPLHKLAVPYLRWTLTQDADAMLDQATDTTRRILRQIGASPVPRIVDNFIVMVFGLIAFDGWAKSVGVDVPTVELGPVLKRMLRELSNTADMGDDDDDDRTDSDRPIRTVSRIKNAFDGFLEYMSLLERREALLEGREYVVVDGKLRLHLPSCYATYLRERAQTRQEDETNGLRSLQRLAAELAEQGDSYITDASRRTHMRRPSSLPGSDLREKDDVTQQLRCVEVDEDKVPRWLDFRRFHTRAPRAEHPTYEVN